MGGWWLVILLLVLIFLVDNFKGYREKKKRAIAIEIGNNLYKQNKKFHAVIKKTVEERDLIELENAMLKEKIKLLEREGSRDG